MSDKFEDAIALVAPQIGWPIKAARRAAYGLAGVILAVAVGWAGWKLLFADRAARRVTTTIQGKADTATATAGREAAQAAIPIIINNNTKGAAIDAQTQEVMRDILKAKGADQQVDPALDALVRRAICMRASAASLSGCERLRGTDP